MRPSIRVTFPRAKPATGGITEMNRLWLILAAITLARTTMGFQFQSTSDVGGGQNTSHAAADYYLTYDLNVDFAGVYQIDTFPDSKGFRPDSDGCLIAEIRDGNRGKTYENKKGLKGLWATIVISFINNRVL